MASETPFKNKENVGKLAHATAAFALDLYQAVGKGKDDQNIFFSPISLNTALSMVLLGAKGNTADQMKSTLKLQEFVDSDIHATFSDLHNVLQTGAKSAYIMRVANRLFASKNYSLLTEYLDATKESYKTESALLDFAGDSEGSRKTINKWVEEQTNNKIQDLIPDGVISVLTTIILVNAVYFKGDWQEKFDSKHTMKSPFFLNKTEKVEVDLMFREDTFMVGYNQEMGCQVLELPYVNNELSMVLIIPKQFRLAELEGKLDADKLMALTNDLHKMKAMAYVPKFKLTDQLKLSDTLKSLGMTEAFDETKADLSGIDGTQHLHISEVIHKSYIEVNEEGSEAAAASAVTISLNCLPPEFRADRPFIFLIRDKRSGVILFMGRVANPTV